jgi:hypothetical protein
VDWARHQVLVARSFVRLDDDAAHALDHRSVMHGAVDFRDDRFLPRVTRFDSSTTRGRPPVRSFAFVVARGIGASESPG